MEKVLFTLLAIATFVAAQDPGRWFDYLPVIREYLDLSTAQMEAIGRSNEEHDQWTWSKQLRLAQVQREIWAERARTSPDPTALGVRYVEIEAICRDLAARVVEQRTKNQRLLTETQHAKLKALEDALTLLPAIQQAQTLRLVGEPAVNLGGTILFEGRVTTGDAFSRTDGTRIAVYPNAACSPAVFPGNIIPAGRL